LYARRCETGSFPSEWIVERELFFRMLDESDAMGFLPRKTDDQFMLFGVKVKPMENPDAP